MRVRSSLTCFAAVLVLGAGISCGDDGVSAREAEDLLRPLVEEGQADRVALVAFKKVDGHAGEFGVPFYLLDYSGTVEFKQDSMLEFSTTSPHIRAYPLTPPRPACEPGAPATATKNVWECKEVKRGDHLRLEGTIRFEKSDKGWQPVRAAWLDPNKVFIEPKK